MLKKKELIILSWLRRNARENLTSISKKTNIPVSTIFDKLKSYRGSIIKKHTTLIDFSKLGFNARANIMLKADIKDREALIQSLTNNPHINSVYKINNGYDFLVEVIFVNIKELEDFIEHLEAKFNIKNKQVYYIIEDIKREAFLTDHTMIEMITQN